MTRYAYPNYPTAEGYMTEKIRHQYISKAIEEGKLPENAHRLPDIVSLTASNDIRQPIQFWQLYSVLGQERIVRIVTSFYERVFADEDWFSRVFAQVGDINHHINTQASMWIDVMGGGRFYHGGEFRLNFHHTHNAMQLMNERGSERWATLMIQTLNDASLDMTNDARARVSINTFLHYFFGKYADDFKFETTASFGETNPSIKRRINFLKMTDEAIKSLSERELIDALRARGVDFSDVPHKDGLVKMAQRL